MNEKFILNNQKRGNGTKWQDLEHNNGKSFLGGWSSPVPWLCHEHGQEAMVQGVQVGDPSTWS